MISTTAAICLLAGLTASFAYALRTPTKNSHDLPGDRRETFHHVPAKGTRNA